MTLAPSEFAQLTVQHPRLWWPNGYGKPELYTLQLTFLEGNTESDTKELRFGIREITYELSLLDGTGHLRRLEYSPTTARLKHEQVVDVRHEGMREIPAADPFPSDLSAGMERRMEVLGRVADAGRRAVAVDKDARRYENFTLPGDQSQRRAHRLPRR